MRHVTSRLRRRHTTRGTSRRTAIWRTGVLVVCMTALSGVVVWQVARLMGPSTSLADGWQQTDATRYASSTRPAQPAAASPAATGTTVSGAGASSALTRTRVATPAPTATPKPKPTPAPTKPPADDSAPQGAVTAGQPCQDRTMFVARITQWTVPPGCYAQIYTPDQSAYTAPSRFGYCNWWVEALHPKQQDILSSKKYTRTSKPVPGAAVWFDPGVQGASPAGHWAQAVAVAPDGYWVLITEMNFGWRGGGFGKVDYRYIHTGPGVEFVY